jgi:hypothetical protein
MTAATFILVIAGVYLAFRAGGRWRHNKLAWADAKATKVKWQVLKKFRWVTLRASLVAALVLVIYLFVSGAISLHIGHDDAVPAQVGHTTKPSPHKS